MVISAPTTYRKHIVWKNRVSKIAVLDGQIQLFCGRKPEVNKRPHLCRIIHVSCLQPTAALKAVMDGQHHPAPSHGVGSLCTLCYYIKDCRFKGKKPQLFNSELWALIMGNAGRKKWLGVFQSVCLWGRDAVYWNIFRAKHRQLSLWTASSECLKYTASLFHRLMWRCGGWNWTSASTSSGRGGRVVWSQRHKQRSDHRPWLKGLWLCLTQG